MTKMTREDLIREIKQTMYPRETEVIEDYCRIFANTDEATRRAILGEEGPSIGRQLTEGWDRVYSALERGITRIRTPLGAILYRVEESPIRKFYKALVPDNMPAAECIPIFKDICGLMGIENPVPAAPRPAQETTKPWIEG